MTVLTYPYENVPATGAAVAVAPGVLWVRLPLPYALDHVNVWLLEDGVDAQGRTLWTVVDTGVGLDGIKDVWRRLLPAHPLRRQIVTHCHPDHLGLAAWLERETGAPLWISFGEYAMAQLFSVEAGDFSIAAMVALFARHGLAPERLAALTERGNGYVKVVPEIPRTYHRLLGGERLRIGAHTWQTIAGYGHSPEHISLYCEELRLLISGDMMLPRISTNVSVLAATPDANPLGLFLDSIAAFRTLPADTLVLPSHGKPFRGLQTRITELQQHHRARCSDLLAACDEPKSAAELMPVLFPRDITDAHQTMFAMGESLAHINYLAQSGTLVAGSDAGIIKFSKQGAQP